METHEKENFRKSIFCKLRTRTNSTHSPGGLVGGGRIVGIVKTTINLPMDVFPKVEKLTVKRKKERNLNMKISYEK